MDENDIGRAVALLSGPRRGGSDAPAALPEGCAPKTAGEALAIQDALVRTLGESVPAWKVAGERDGVLMRGAILRSRLLDSPARIAARDVPLLGVEAEIAFAFDRELPQRADGYDREAIAAAVTALVAIEVVDSRFRSYHDAPFLDRLADCMSNGALVTGTRRSDWRSFDLSKLEVVLTIGGKEIARSIGGHGSGDPILPAIDFANDFTKRGPIPAGTIVTTGTYTGINFAAPGDEVTVAFTGFGEAELRFEA